MKNFSRVGFLAIILLVSLCPLTHWFVNEALGVDPGTYSWPMFHYDIRRKGYAKFAGPLTNNTLWIQQLNESIVFSSPAVVNGSVFIGGYRETLGTKMPSSVWCLNETTGAILWRYETGSCISSSPIVVDGRVFIGSYDYKLYCLDETTGAELWNFTTGGEIFSSPVVDHMIGVSNPDRVFFGSMDGNVYCLNESNGAWIWQYPTNGPVESSPAIFEKKVFIGSDDNYLYCLKEETGTLVWRYLTSGPVRSTPSIGVWSAGALKVVGVGSDDGHLYAIHTDTGLAAWVSPYLGGAVLSSPAVRTDLSCNFYVGSMNGSVYSIGYPGVIIWNSPIGGTVSSSPALDGLGNLYVGHAWSKIPPGVYYGAVKCLNIRNGSITWTYNTGTHVTSSPAIADGMVFVGAKDGKVYCFGNPLGNVDAIAVWQHTEEQEHGWDIWYSVWDESAGRWWTPTGAVAAPIAMLPHGDEHDPNIAFNRLNESICVWSHWDDDTSNYDIWYSKWEDPIGYMWSPPMPVATITGNDYDPAIAFDTNGFAIAVWVHEFANLTRAIYYSLWNGTNWIGPAGPLSLQYPYAMSAILSEITFTATAVKGGNTPHQAVAIWTEIDYMTMYSVWNGTTWTFPTRIPGSYWTVPATLTVPATYRNGISSDKIGNTVAVWGTNDLNQPLYYAVWNGSSWIVPGTEIPIATNNLGIMPAIAFNSTDVASVVYTRHPTLIDIGFTQYKAGFWTSASTAADSSADDWRPSIAYLLQDTAITVWWSNAIPPGEIYYSRWNKTSWSPATPIVPLPGLNGTDRNPAIASVSGSPTMPVSVHHDVALTGIKVVKTVVGQGYSTFIDVVVENQGDLTETFNVTAYANTTTIETKETTLTSGNSTTLIFTWNTTGVAKGNYTITAKATQLPGETDTTDNTLTDGWIIVAMPGDITGPDGYPDGKVDMRDIYPIAKAFLREYPDPRYNPNADINNDGKNDMKDVYVIAKNFLKEDP